MLYLSLSRNKYAVFQNIRTETITVDSKDGQAKKAKLFITLTKHEDFEENMRKFNEIKEENEKLQAAKSGTPTDAVI